jgi:hypothetical protein
MTEVNILQGSHKYVHAPLMLTLHGISYKILLFYFTPRTNSDFYLYVVKTVLWNIEVTRFVVSKEIRKERRFIRAEFIPE